MQAIIIALLEAKGILNEKEAETIYDKLKHSVIPESLVDARRMIKTILKK